MQARSFHSRLSATFVALTLAFVLGISAQFLQADPTTRPVPAPDIAKIRADAAKSRAKFQAIMQEVIKQPEGIHKLSDGSICIKSGQGMAHVHDDGRGCGTGCNINTAPTGPDGDLMAGVFFGVFAKSKEAQQLGIGPEQAAKVQAACSYMDYEHTNPSAVLKLYNDYAKLPEGKARSDAEQALMDRVRVVGQAYIDAEVKKVKDVKAVLTPNQIRGLKVIGAKMLRPGEVPVA